MDRTDTDDRSASNRHHQDGTQNYKRPLERGGSDSRPAPKMPRPGNGGDSKDLRKRDASTLRDAEVGTCSDAKKHKPSLTADGANNASSHPEEHEFACMKKDLAYAIEEIKRQKVEMERMKDELAAMREMKRELIKRGVIPWYSKSPPIAFHPCLPLCVFDSMCAMMIVCV
jgi:hypothetical protein